MCHFTMTINGHFCMWTGGILERNPVRPAGKWAKGLIFQTGKTPACHIQFAVCSLLNINFFAHFCYYQPYYRSKQH